MQFRMPSYESVARNVQRLTRQRSRLALGVVAASAATVGSVAGLAAGSAPAVAAVSAVAPVGHTTPAVPAHAAAATWRAFPVRAAAATWPAFSHPGQPSSQPVPDVVRIVTGAQLAAPVQAVPATSAAVTRPAAAASQPASAASPQSATATTPVAPAAAAPAAQPSAAPPAPAQPQPAPQPWQFYDSVTPSSVQGQNAVAVYANGSYAAQPSQVHGHTRVMWIDTNGSDPHADVLDVEPGDATPAQAAAWAAQKLNAKPTSTAIIYTMRSDWAAVQQAIAQLPWWMPSHTKYWIADPTGVPHVVPGSQATQWYWGQNYDISTATPGF